MADIVSKRKRSTMMAGIKPENTKPEILVRKSLHKSGFRYRKNYKKVLGKADIVLPKHRVAIFVNGCFWHGHEECELFRFPKSNVGFWKSKISGNIARDKRNHKELLSCGWRVLVVWECSFKRKEKLLHAVILLMKEWILESGETYASIRRDSITGLPFFLPAS